MVNTTETVESVHYFGFNKNNNNEDGWETKNVYYLCHEVVTFGTFADTSLTIVVSDVF